MVLLSYKYRIYPSKKQQSRLLNQFNICKIIYNKLLATSIDSYKYGKISLNKFDYNNIIKSETKQVHSQVLQNVSDRVHKSFQNFFARIKLKSCKNKGFPRYKSNIKSITYPQSGYKFLSNKQIKISRIGKIPIKLHRTPKGKLKTLTIKKNKANQWYVILTCEKEINKIVHLSKEKIGIDVGLQNFATLSNGAYIKNPRFLIKSEKRLVMLQRKLSNKKKGSKNRMKSRIELARQHIKVVNQRNDFLHKLSYSLTKQYSLIAVEELNIKGMLNNKYLSKHIHDASWNNFINMLKYKAVISGSTLLKNPRTRYSSKRCSNCGTLNNNTLSTRIFNCVNCNLTINRDLNGAINHLKDTVGLTEIQACEHSVRPSLKAVMDEAGTIRHKLLENVKLSLTVVNHRLTKSLIKN